MSARVSLLLVAVLISGGCSSGSCRRSSARVEAQAVPSVGGAFREKTEWVRAGLPLRAVRSLLGSPHREQAGSGRPLVSEFGGTSLLVYAVPDLSTISFVVGVKEGRVTGSGFVFAAYPPALGVLSVERYWLAEDAAQPKRWRWN